jgi:gliding motility-associated-like protein
VSLGNDRIICDDDSTALATSGNYTGYLWSTGATTPTLTVDTSGSYWVRVTNSWECEASDTVSIFFTQAVETTVDTVICSGERYFAQGAWQTNTGIYRDTLQTISGCDSIIITDLGVKPPVYVDLGNDTTLCPGDQVVLHATTPFASAYVWQDGSTDSMLVARQPGEYWVHVTVDGCMAGDTVQIRDCPSQLWVPTAFTPNGDGLNDLFRPVGVSITKFTMYIYDRWGTRLFTTDDIQSGWNGIDGSKYYPPGSYSYLIRYEVAESPGETKTAKGTFSLVR